MAQYSSCNSTKAQRIKIDLNSLCVTSRYEANLWPDNVITTSHDAHQPKNTFLVSLPCKGSSCQTVNKTFFEHHKPME